MVKIYSTTPSAILNQITKSLFVLKLLNSDWKLNKNWKETLKHLKIDVTPLMSNGKPPQNPEQAFIYSHFPTVRVPTFSHEILHFPTSRIVGNKMEA